MSKVAKEILRQFVKEENFESPEGVIAAMKSMFKDVLQEALEVDMFTLV